jgi:transposase-like protein
MARTREEKWNIVLEGFRAGNVAETCRRCEISPSLYYRWKDEARQRAIAAPDTVKDQLIRQLEGALKRKTLEAEILRNVAGRTCGEVHSRAKKLVKQGYEPKLVASALSISRSSLYYRNHP